MQVEVGLIPYLLNLKFSESHITRLDWMYQGPECSTNINTAEDYLLGKPVKEQKKEDKKHFTPIFQESYSNPKNELFTKIHEDPMLIMKKEEVRQRKEIEDNPYKMKLLMREIEESMQGRKDRNEKKKHKKDKKEKHSKKDEHSKKDKKERDYSEKRHKKSRSRSSRNSSSDSSRSRSKNKYREDSKGERLSFTTPGLIASRLNTGTTYGLVDKLGKKLNVETPKIRDYRPDESLYRDKITNLEKEKELRRKKTGNNWLIIIIESETRKYKNLSQEEREKILRDMERKAEVLDLSKNLKVEESQRKERQSEKYKSEPKSKPDFIR